MNKRNILTLASIMAILLVPAAFSGAQADQQAAEPDYMATEFVWVPANAVPDYMATEFVWPAKKDVPDYMATEFVWLPTNHVPDYMATEFLWLPVQHDVVASK